MFSEFWPVILTTMLPVAELRGGIPIGFVMGLDPVLVVITAIIVNCLIFFPIFFGVSILYKDVLSKWGTFNRVVERAHRRIIGHMERWGILSLAIFVGIPLPVTGVWTGTIIAWFLGLDWKKSFLAIALGVLISATIVTIASWGIIFGLNAANGG